MTPPRRPWQERQHDYRYEPRRAIFADPRLGKTRVVVDAWEDLSPARALVTCPLKVAPFWVRELRERGFHVVEGYAHTTLWVRSHLPERGGVLVLNDDKAHALADALVRWKPDCFAIDESHRMKSPSSNRGKALRKIAKAAPWVRILTGTPAPNHYGDLWGQMVALDPLLFSSYTAFANRFLITDPYFHNRVIGHRNTDELQSMILKYATIVRREDVFGPDTYQVVTRRIEMPPAARAQYNRLATSWVLDDLHVEAALIVTRLMRLQQIASGFVKNDQGDSLDLHTAKLDAVEGDLEAIIAADEKAVIFHRFTWEAQRYEAIARRLCPLVVTINGGVRASQADANIDAFRRAPGPAIAVVQIQAGGTGVDFATAHHALFVSSGFSYADHKQAQDRIYSPRARRVVTSYVMEDTVDEFIAETLAMKGDVADAVRNADRRSMVFGRIKKGRAA